MNKFSKIIGILSFAVIALFFYANSALGVATEPSPTANSIFHDVFTASTGTGTAWGQAIKVDQFSELSLQIASSGTTTATIKCYGSKSETEPTWASSASPNNRYSGKYMVNENTGGSVAGDTGVVIAGNDIVNEYLINVEHIRWFNCNISSYSQGSIYATLVGRK